MKTCIIMILNALVISCLYSQENLINNGDFETRTISPWSVPAWTNNTIPPQVDMAVCQGPGNVSLKFAGTMDKNAFVLQRIKLSPEIKKLKFGGWMKTLGFQNSWTASITLECVVINSGKESYEYFRLATQWQLSDTDWTSYEKIITVPENTRYVGIILQTNGPNGNSKKINTGTVWFDNIFVEKVSEQEINP